MRLILIPFAVLLTLAWTINACKSASDLPTFCDTSCLRDSIKFTKEEHHLKTYVYISAANCIADTITWSFIDMGINRKMGFPELLGTPVKLNKDNISCYIKDTSFAWVSFNDCSNG